MTRNSTCNAPLQLKCMDGHCTVTCSAPSQECERLQNKTSTLYAYCTVVVASSVCSRVALRAWEALRAFLSGLGCLVCPCCVHWCASEFLVVVQGGLSFVTHHSRY